MIDTKDFDSDSRLGVIRLEIPVAATAAQAFKAMGKELRRFVPVKARDKRRIVFLGIKESVATYRVSEI